MFYVNEFADRLKHHDAETLGKLFRCKPEWAANLQTIWSGTAENGLRITSPIRPPLLYIYILGLWCPGSNKKSVDTKRCGLGKSPIAAIFLSADDLNTWVAMRTIRILARSWTATFKRPWRAAMTGTPPGPPAITRSP